MNKYKDALNELFVYSKHSANKVEILSLIECYEKLEQLINEHFELKEKHEKLVDKATPKKGVWKYDCIRDGVLCCPNCNKVITNVWSKLDYEPKYCHCCGQALDWSKDDE